MALLALYHFGPVANSLTPLLCLIEKGLAFDDRFLNSRKWEHHTPEFQAINPQGMVPVLLHDDRVVTESTVINEYLEDVFAENPLRPADPWQRAQMRVWTKYVDEYFCPALTVIGAQGAKPYASAIDKDEMRAILARMPNAEVRRKWEVVSGSGYSDAELDEARAKLGRVIARMEAQLAHGEDWILGPDYSLADIKLFSMAPGLERVLPDVCNASASPNLHGWLRRMDARPAVQAMRAKEYKR
jgi:glutathione S-transferase